jgi:hypothetical protein
VDHFFGVGLHLAFSSAFITVALAIAIFIVEFVLCLIGSCIASPPTDWAATDRLRSWCSPILVTVVLLPPPQGFMTRIVTPLGPMRFFLLPGTSTAIAIGFLFPVHHRASPVVPWDSTRLDRGAAPAVT